jgi:hypothetical protein
VGGQIVLSRPSADSFSVSRRQKGEITKSGIEDPKRIDESVI